MTIADLQKWFETMTPETVNRVSEFYHSDAYFKDPHNEVHRAAHIQRIFTHMFEVINNPKFTFLKTFGSESTGEYMLLWRFDLEFKSGQKIFFDGVSHIKMVDGKVKYHCDYWDPAESMYEKIPVMGGFFRFIKQKIQVKQID